MVLNIKAGNINHYGGRSALRASKKLRIFSYTTKLVASEMKLLIKLMRRPFLKLDFHQNLEWIISFNPLLPDWILVFMVSSG